MPDRVGVVITSTAERRALAERCVASFATERTDDIQLTTIVVGNGSDPRVDADENILLNKATSLAETHNVGLDRARELDCAYALVLNDDTVAEPGMCAALLEANRDLPRSIMTPVQLEMDEGEAIDELAIEFLSHSRDLIGDALLGRELQRSYPVSAMVGASMFARMDVFNAIGPFDELFQFYCVDDDYFARAKYHNVALAVVPRARLQHLHGRFQDDPTADAKRWFTRWRTSQQGHMILALKRHDRSLAIAYLREVVRVKLQALSCLLQGWPRGTFTLATEFTRLTFHLPRIAKHRREHYPPR